MPKKSNPVPDHDLDPDSGPANDNRKVVLPAANDNGGGAKETALSTAAILSLQGTFAKVDTTSISHRPATPFLAFKSREGGLWMFGQRKTIPDPDSLWAVNPKSFQWGWVCWGDASKVLAEKLVPISEPLPAFMELPEKGFPWQQELAVNLKCTCGADAGAEVSFKTNTEGGKGEVTRLIEAVRDRVLGSQHDGKVAPIVKLGASSYPHPQYGKTWTPTLTVVDWMTMDGPEPTPAPTPTSPPEQPRRRRVA